MPIQSKYSDQKIETILAEVAAVFDKHNASSDLVLMIAGNIATNVINQKISKEQRVLIAEKFSQALMSSIEGSVH
ncbi:DUF1414 domain-containing protein [Vibrio viridaestus]|uniref:UPF0352 protein EES38_06305 n=1 Tax=Vibrio viridaestus TaxID=2487322 RepID=A0A3N9U7N6_9VIBR|nr:DUF1414 domain-containing protein [Vibrio viridaestus]RQW64196.1 DUF1414 domain-containing protein [Vibrio viridaestus]